MIKLSLPSEWLKPAKGNRFVVHKHQATHLHYDFRLEMDGVLKSWAVPKGVPTEEGIRRLAIQVEDHLLSYIDFSGEIPTGQYGAGTVEIWDRGSYELVTKERDKLEFKLEGSKLSGDYALYRMSGKDWLIIKQPNERGSNEKRKTRRTREKPAPRPQPHGDVEAQDVEQRMRELRRQGLSLREIAKATGCSESKVQRVVKDVSMPVGFYQRKLRLALVEGSVINLETTGTDSQRDDIITFGFLEQNTITVIQRVEATDDEFYSIITEKLAALEYPIYAYDAGFQEDFLLAKLRLPVEIVDILEPWRQKSRTKGVRYPTLDELATVPREYFGERVVPDREVHLLWASYERMGDKRKLSEIVRHCMEDLRQALYVMTFMEEPASDELHSPQKRRITELWIPGH